MGTFLALDIGWAVAEGWAVISSANTETSRITESVVGGAVEGIIPVDMAFTDTFGISESVFNTVPAFVHFWANTAVTGWLTLALPVATVFTGPVSHNIAVSEEV